MRTFGSLRPGDQVLLVYRSYNITSLPKAVLRKVEKIEDSIYQGSVIIKLEDGMVFTAAANRKIRYKSPYIIDSDPMDSLGTLLKEQEENFRARYPYMYSDELVLGILSCIRLIDGLVKEYENFR